MTTTVDAIYEHGKLVLPQPLSLPEHAHVRVTIESDPERKSNGLAKGVASVRGFARKFNPQPMTTDEWMKILREGEQ